MSTVAARKGAIKLALLGLIVFALVLAEIAAILWVAGQIGWWTLVILSASMVVGVYLLQREWRKAWSALSAALTSGQLPSGQLADASLVLIGGVLLVVPGLLTDVAGLLLLLPFTRPFIRSGIAWWASKTMQRSGAAPTIIRGDVVTETVTWVPVIDPSTTEHNTIRGKVVGDDQPADRDREVGQ